MAFCGKCGSDMGMAVTCPSCGYTRVQTPDGGYTPPSNSSFVQPSSVPMQQPGMWGSSTQGTSMPGQAYYTPAVDSGSFGWVVLGFFIPVSGITLYFAWKNFKPLSGKKALIGAIASIVVGLILTVVGSSCVATAIMGSLY